VANLKFHEIDFQTQFTCFILEHPQISRSADSLVESLKTQNSQLTIQRIKGYSGAKCSRKIFQKVHTSPDRKWFLPSELACLFGHRKILRLFLKSKFNYALILEDDISIHQELLKILNKIATYLKNDFILSPFESGFEIPLIFCNKSIDQDIVLERNIGASRGTYTIFLDRIAAQKVLNEMHYYLPADHFYGLPRHHGSRNFFIRGKYVNLLEVPSTIDGNNRNDKRDIRPSILFSSISRKSHKARWYFPYFLLWFLMHIQQLLNQLLGKKGALKWLPCPFGKQIENHNTTSG